MAKLTQSYIARAQYEKNADERERDVRWDESLPGFGVRVHPSGRKTFVISYRVAGRKRLMSIGVNGVFTLNQAKKRARELLVGVANQRDPLGEKQRELKSETFQDLFEQFMKTRWSENKSASEDQRRSDKYLVPSWRTRKVRSITHQDVVRLHRKIGERSIYEANRTLALISVMWKFAKAEGFIERTDDNPAEGVKKFAETKRTRYLSEDELPRLSKAIREHGDLYVGPLIWLFLLLGCRKSELLTAKWEFVDFSNRVLRLPTTKNGEPFCIHLSDPALVLLEKIPHEDGNPFIFPGRGNNAGQGTHMANLDKYWQEIRRAAGLEDVRLHDLRRTFASWMAQSGTSLHLISKALNHSGVEITNQHYAHLSTNSMRVPLNDHAANIMKVAKRRPTPLLGGQKNG